MTTTALVKPGNAQGLKAMISTPAFSASLAEVLPKYMQPEKMIKLALVAASKNPKLFECTQESLLLCIMTSAQLGLDCSGATGEAYLVPHYNGRTKQMEAVFIQGYRGKIHIVTREGGVVKIEARIVYEKDDFEIQYGTKPMIHHTPLFGKERGEIIGAYAVATLQGGTTQFEAMTIEDLEKTEKDALKKTRGYGPWKDHRAEMIRKTPVHRLSKYLPLSSNVRAQAMLDHVGEPEIGEPKKSAVRKETSEERLLRIEQRERFENRHSGHAQSDAEVQAKVAEDDARLAREKENHERALRGESPTPPPPIEKDPPEHDETEPHGVTDVLIDEAETRGNLEKDTEAEAYEAESDAEHTKAQEAKEKGGKKK